MRYAVLSRSVCRSWGFGCTRDVFSKETVCAALDPRVLNTHSSTSRVLPSVGGLQGSNPNFLKKRGLSPALNPQESGGLIHPAKRALLGA